jgi:hypothetical protein
LAIVFSLLFVFVVGCAVRGRWRRTSALVGFCGCSGLREYFGRNPPLDAQCEVINITHTQLHAQGVPWFLHC